MRSRRRTYAGSAEAVTGTRPGRTGDWRSSCRRVRSTGTVREECCVSTASGCSRFCCRAVWSLLRGTGLQLRGGQFETERKAGNGQENPAQQREGQQTADQHQVLWPADRVGQSLSDRRGIYPRRGAGSISQGVLGPRTAHDTGECTDGACGV